MLQTRKIATAPLGPRRVSAASLRLLALACAALPALAAACGGGTEFGGDSHKSADANLAGSPSGGTGTGSGGHSDDGSDEP